MEKSYKLQCNRCGGKLLAIKSSQGYQRAVFDKNNNFQYLEEWNEPEDVVFNFKCQNKECKQNISCHLKDGRVSETVFCLHPSSWDEKHPKFYSDLLPDERKEGLFVKKLLWLSGYYTDSQYEEECLKVEEMIDEYMSKKPVFETEKKKSFLQKLGLQ